MFIICKCGNTLTQALNKTKYQDAYIKVDDKYVVRPGTYHRRERKRSIEDYKKTYVISEEDLVDTVQCRNQEKGCCGFDYYELQCNHCNTKIGYGYNDCWQDSAAHLFTIKTKLVNQ